MAETPTMTELSLTEAAKDALEQTMRAHGIWGWGVRVRLAGEAFDLSFEQFADRADVTVSSEGIKLFVDEDTLATLSGTEIDHDGRGFKFRKR